MLRCYITHYFLISLRSAFKIAAAILAQYQKTPTNENAVRNPWSNPLPFYCTHIIYTDAACRCLCKH